MTYLVFDLETTTTKHMKRTASPFCKENWVVAAGYKEQGSLITAKYYVNDAYNYACVKPSGITTPYQIKIPEQVTMLVGFNIKFDLLYSWNQPDLLAFFKRGGQIWDCQYAEYLLEGQLPPSHMMSMDDMVEGYGGVLKIDEVKALWKAGVNTPDIDKDLLLRYLAGEDGDIANTERIFIGQVAKARELGIVQGIMSRMDGLLATTEMEYNGLHVDEDIAFSDKVLLQGELASLYRTLDLALPLMPPELEFNWGSVVHKSCLLYGGSIGYKKRVYKTDESGNRLYAKKPVVHLLMDNDYEPIPLPRYEALSPQDQASVRPMIQTYKGGKKKGEFKTKIIQVDDLDKPKSSMQDFYFTLPRQVKPKDEWKGALTDAKGEPVYSTSGECIDWLAAHNKGIEFLQAMKLRDKVNKDLSVYYEKDGSGMLTTVDDGFIHHSLNHVNTVTSRLSSTNPNLQNLTRSEYDAGLGRAKSLVKRMFTSRFDGGKMIEIDYSQLEVVVQAILTGDEQMIQDVNDGVDFHVKRLAAKLNEPYDYVYERCHNEDHPDYPIYKPQRTAAKGFTFARAFGAGKASIAADTGMSEDEVQLLIDAEEEMYPNVSKFYDGIERVLDSTRVPSLHREYLPDKPTVSVQCGVGYYTGLTQTRFGFYEVPAPAFKRKTTGKQTAWYRPSIQNFPIQGTAGHLVQMALGKLFRHMIERSNYNDRAYVCNTVHDCVWVDCAPELVDQVAQEVQEILESIPSILKETFDYTCPVKFPCEVEVGDDLLTMKGIK